MKKNLKVHVTFRSDTDKLTSMFINAYDSIEDAKQAIELDASYFVKAHKYRGGALGMKFRQKAHWVHPKTEDYFEACGQDGCKCYWQYFLEH